MMSTNSTSKTPAVSFLFLAAFIFSAGCAGISDNSSVTAHHTPTVDQADLKANTEVVTTVFNGTRQQEDIIVVRPDL